MNIRPDADIAEFLKTVEKCRFDVLFLTEEGDRLNLKSALSQYVFAMIASKRELLCAGHIQCAREDIDRLAAFFIS